MLGKEEDMVELQRRFSQAAYEIFFNKIQKDIADNGYTLDTTKSGRETKVFVNQKKKNVIAAYRGTDLGDKRRRFKTMTIKLISTLKGPR